MRYEKIKNLGSKEFRRLTGVKTRNIQKDGRDTMDKLCRKKEKRRTKSKLLVEDMLLIALEYWRENRTYFHIAKGYEIHVFVTGKESVFR